MCNQNLQKKKHALFDFTDLYSSLFLFSPTYITFKSSCSKQGLLWLYQQRKALPPQWVRPAR